MAAQAVCKIDGCDKGGKLKRGWCSGHYERWRKHGSTEVNNARKRTDCAFEGCQGKAEARGLCGKHYAAMVRATPVFGMCAVAECDRPSVKRGGHCALHEYRSRSHGDPEAGRTLNGRALKYLHDHMHDDCPKWPFVRNENGYGTVRYRGRNRQIHRLVCEIVHGPPPTTYHVAAHSCGKGHEGCFGAACLRWATRAENAQDAIAHGTWVHGETHPFAVLTDAQALEVFGLRFDRKRGALKAAAERYGVSPATISDIWAGRTWAWLTGGARALS